MNAADVCYNTLCLNQMLHDEYLEEQREEQQKKAITEVDDELQSLLENNGFGDFYHAIYESDAWQNALKAETADRYPDLF